MAHVRGREWQGLCKNAGVPGLTYEGGSGRAYVRMWERQELCNSVGVARLT